MLYICVGDLVLSLDEVFLFKTHVDNTQMSNNCKKERIKRILDRFQESHLSRNWEIIGKGVLPDEIRFRPPRYHKGISGIWFDYGVVDRILECPFDTLLITDKDGEVSIRPVEHKSFSGRDIANIFTRDLTLRGTAVLDPTLNGDSYGGLYFLKIGSPAHKWLNGNLAIRNVMNEFRESFLSKYHPAMLSEEKPVLVSEDF